MTEDEREQAYMDGSRAAWLSIFNEALRHLGMDDPVVKAAAYLEERVATIAYLRRTCPEYGDNDWPDDLYIPDIIEKHLVCYFEDTECIRCGELRADCHCDKGPS